MTRLVAAFLATTALAYAPVYAASLPIAADGASATPTPFPSPAPYFPSGYSIKSFGGAPGFSYSDPFNPTNGLPTPRAVPIAPLNAPWAIQRTGDNMPGAFSMTPSGGVPSAGAFATDGSQSYQPSIFGNWLSNTATTYPWTPVVGTGKNPDGTPQLTSLFTQNILQWQGNGALGNQLSGLALNGDVVGGTAPSGTFNNMVGIHDVVRRRPGPNGEAAPFVWVRNWENLDAPGSGGAGTVGEEGDIDNNNKRQPVGGGFNIGWWCNGTSAYMSTSCFYSGGSNTFSQGGMKATMSGHSITLTTGTFVGDNPYIQFTDPNNTAAGTQFFRIDIVDTTHAVTDANLPTETTAVAISAPVAHMDAPFLVNGFNASKTADFWAISAAVTGFRSQGIHQVAFDSQSDQAVSFARMRQGQYLSFAGSDISLNAPDANTLRSYIHGANPALDVVGTTASGVATDWLALSNGAAGNGGSISVKTGLSTPVQLGLAGANGGGAKVTGNLFTTQSFYLNDGATGLGATVAAGLNVAPNTDLFLRVPNGGKSAFIQSYNGAANFAQFNSGGATLFNGLIAANLATAAQAGVKGTLCSDANGLIYVKTTTGACL